MPFVPFYLPACYGLGSGYLLLLYLSGESLTLRDVIVFLLSPITLPLSAFMRLLGVLLDLDFVCFKREM